MSQILENPVKVHKDHFIYSAVAASIASGASSTSIIQIQADSDFVAVKLSYFADIAGATQTDSTRVVPLISVAIQDTGSGRNLQNVSIPVDAMAGRGELPLVLPIPRRFKGSANINVTFTNYSAATTYVNVSLNFIGYKEFYLG